MMAEPGDRGGEAPLQEWGSGAQPSNARLRDGLVYREAGPWSPTVLALRVRSASWMLTNRSALQRAIS